VNLENEVEAEAEQRVLLFSGHMIDAPDRAEPRFPPALEGAVDHAVRAEIDRLDAGPADIAVSSGACGGDILFAEAVADRGVQTRIYLPFDEPTFIEKSVSFADDRWTDRYFAVTARSQRFCAPDVLGPLPKGDDPYERVNLWMLDEARRLGRGNVSFICVWDGQGGDGPGGTKHMIDTVRAQRGGHVVWIDIRNL
jgi:hypothetical protein